MSLTFPYSSNSPLKNLFNHLNLYDEKVISLSYHQVITVRNWVLMITSKLTMKIVGYGTIIQANVDIQGIDAITHLSCGALPDF